MSCLWYWLIIIITYQRKLNLTLLVTDDFLRDEWLSDKHLIASESESESESPSIMATSQESESESDSVRSPESESKSVKSPESDSESEQHHHDSQTQQVLIEYYLLGPQYIVSLHDRPAIVSATRKRSMTTIQLSNLANLHRNKTHCARMGCAAALPCAYTGYCGDAYLIGDMLTGRVPCTSFELL